VRDGFDDHRAQITTVKCNCGAINSLSTFRVERCDFSTRNPRGNRAQNGYFDV